MPNYSIIVFTTVSPRYPLDAHAFHLQVQDLNLMSVWHDLFLTQYHPGSFARIASGLHTLHSLPNIPSMTARKKKKWCTADLLPAEICYCTKRQVRYSHKVSHTQRLPFIDATSHFGGRRQETLGSFSCLWHVFGRQTWTESFVLKYVGSKLIHHLKRTLEH